jgi:hypothetical protein
MSGFFQKRLRRGLVIGLLSVVLTGAIGHAYATSTTSDDGIADPKGWCGEVTDLIASGQIDKMGEMLRHGSRDAIKTSDASVNFAQVKALVESGEIRLKSFLSEKSYGNSFVREWYMIVVDRQPLFVRCSFIKYDDFWQFVTLDFDTNPDKVLLP